MHTKQTAITLLELLLVMSITTILMIATSHTFSNLMQQMQLRAVTTQFVNTLHSARVIAVREKTHVKVCAMSHMNHKDYMNHMNQDSKEDYWSKGIELTWQATSSSPQRNDESHFLAWPDHFAKHFQVIVKLAGKDHCIVFNEQGFSQTNGRINIRRIFNSNIVDTGTLNRDVVLILSHTGRIRVNRGR